MIMHGCSRHLHQRNHVYNKFEILVDGNLVVGFYSYLPKCSCRNFTTHGIKVAVQLRNGPFTFVYFEDGHLLLEHRQVYKFGVCDIRYV